MELDPEIRAYYDQGEEVERLLGGFPTGPLEFERTKELVLRSLPADPCDVLDVGGGPGTYAAWLSQLGHRVHLVDPVPLHVEQALANAPGITAALGDARRLEEADASRDVVLMLGPLYHLIERDERIAALKEACRVLRPGGVVFVAIISRYAALLDLLLRANALHLPGVFPIVEKVVRTGVFEGHKAGLFTTAYFHLPDEIGEELNEAGFTEQRILPIEGPGAFVTDFPERWLDEARRQALLDAVRLVEDEEPLLATGSHLLGVAHR